MIATWYLGAIVAAWLTFGTNNIDSNWSWRAPTVVQAAPSVVQIIFVWFVPESPRFLIYKGKDEQALKVLADCHANGNQQDEVVQLEMHEIKETIRLEKEFESNSWMELVRTKGNRHRLIICITAGFFSQWSGNGLVSYYIAKILNSIGYTSSIQQNLINGCLQIMNMIVALTMCFFVDKIGRRKLFLVSTAGMLVAFIVWTICSARYAIAGNHNAANAVIAMIYLYYVFYNIAWSGLLVGYTVEILPYSIRAKGMTVMWFCIDAARKWSWCVMRVFCTDGLQCSSTSTSTRLRWRTSGGSTTSSTACGWAWSWRWCGSSTLRRATRHWKRLRSTLTGRTRLWVALQARRRHGS